MNLSENDATATATITLSPSQQAAFNTILEVLPKEGIVVLQGSAGTGKTTLTKYIADHFCDMNVFLCAIAPTHKAKRVIESILNKDALLPTTAYTIASALGKIKEHSYIGAKLYGQGNVKKLSMYGLFLVDEISMIDDKDMRILLDYIRRTKKQAILIGDNYQIPCPSAPYERCSMDMIQKADSFVFTSPDIRKVVLTDIVRQAVDSPIIKLATYVRENLLIDFSIMDAPTLPETFVASSHMYETFELWHAKYPFTTRMIAYTNAAVRTHNIEIRRQLGHATKGPFVVGDILMGYTNFGWPERVIENGQDYIVHDVQLTAEYKIVGYTGLAGWLVTIYAVGDDPIADDDRLVRDLFFINIYKPCNHVFIKELIKRAQKVNAIGSTKNDYLHYMALKNSVLFIEDIYKFERKIYTETTLKESHPLLFTNLSEVFVRSGGATATAMPTIARSLLTDKIETAYPGLLAARLTDSGKVIGDSEQLADCYKVVEKDMYYGYSITAHKSQGSTYDAVEVDESDFAKISNRWNYRHGCMENRIKEKNQMRYVGYTRSRDWLGIVCDACTP